MSSSDTPSRKLDETGRTCPRFKKLRSMIGGKHAKAVAFQNLAHSFAHNWVASTMGIADSQVSPAQIKAIFSDSDGGLAPELDGSFLGGYEF